MSHISCALIPVGCLFEINICAIATAVGCGEVVHGLQNLQQAGDRQVLMKYNEILTHEINYKVVDQEASSDLQRQFQRYCAYNYPINILGSHLAGVCLVVVTLLCRFSAPVESLPGQYMSINFNFTRLNASGQGWFSQFLFSRRYKAGSRRGTNNFYYSSLPGVVWSLP